MKPPTHVYDPDYFDGEVCTVCGDDIKVGTELANAEREDSNA